MHLFVETVEKEFESLTSRATGIVSSYVPSLLLITKTPNGIQRQAFVTNCHQHEVQSYNRIALNVKVKFAPAQALNARRGE